MESWSAAASASHVWVRRWSRPGTSGVGQEDACMALCVTWGPSPGRAVCWAPWKLNPEPLLALLLLGVHPS